MKYPQDSKAFMVWFKNQSEQYFDTVTLEKDIAGLQHQRGTKWRPGLTTQELEDFQRELGVDFPDELIEFYKVMNGTDLPGVNVHADERLPLCYAPRYFSYPEHLPQIKKRIQERLDMNGLTISRMKENNIPFIFPVTDWYFMVIDKITNPICYLTTAYRNHDLSQGYIYGSLWADTLQSWLIKDVFYGTTHLSDLEEFPDRNRVANYWIIRDDD